jgi:hypothetical protein
VIEETNERTQCRLIRTGTKSLESNPAAVKNRMVGMNFFFDNVIGLEYLKVTEHSRTSLSKPLLLCY